MPSRAPDTETRRHSVACHEGDQKQGDSDTVEPVWELHQLSGCSEVYYNHDRSS